MKIYRIAQQFEDEGHDAEENVEERANFEAQKQLDDAALGKSGESHTAEIVSKLKPVLGDYLESSWVANGAVGWFKYDDGIIYEVLVSPATQGHYLSYFKELRARRNRPEETPEDNLKM